MPIISYYLGADAPDPNESDILDPVRLQRTLRGIPGGILNYNKPVTHLQVLESDGRPCPFSELGIGLCRHAIAGAMHINPDIQADARMLHAFAPEGMFAQLCDDVRTSLELSPVEFENGLRERTEVIIKTLCLRHRQVVAQNMAQNSSWKSRASMVSSYGNLSSSKK